MGRGLFVALRNVLKRMSADGLILGAAFVTILLAMILLASGPMYADAVTKSALQRTLRDAPAEESGIAVSLRLPPDQFRLTDAAVSEVLGRVVQATGAEINRVMVAESFDLPPRVATAPSVDGLSEVVEFRFMDGIEEHATLTAGQWPGPGPSSTTGEAVVSEAAARAAGVTVGDVLSLESRRDGRRIGIEIIGVYRTNEPSANFWVDDNLAPGGVVESTTFRTYGPFVVTEDTLTRVIATRVEATWTAHTRFSELSVDEVATLRLGVAGLQRQVEDEVFRAAGDQTSVFSAVGVETGLVSLLSGAERSLTVTRSSVLGLLVQLALLAGYALVLTAGLLTGSRGGETTLLRSRGAGEAHVVGVAVLEAVLLTIPAALTAPWLASYALRLLNVVGPLAGIGLQIEPQVSAAAYWAVVLAAVVAVVGLAWPAFRSARRFGSSSRRHARQSSRSNAQRSGVDLALLLLAALAFWQLGTLGSERAGRIQGRFDVDPLLIVAPALGMLAGAVLALRVIPLIARLAERVVLRGTAAVPALASWQLARRPARHGRAALLLIMAVSIGYFAAAYSGTWLGSQDDQAEHQVGADVRLTPNRRTGDSVSDMFLQSMHEKLDDVETSMPVVRRAGQLPGSDLPAQLLLVDASRAASVVRVRDDVDDEFDVLMATLVAGRPELAGIDLPGRPTQLGLRIAVAEVPIEDEDGELIEVGFNANVHVVVQDGAGLLHRLPLGPIQVDGAEHRLERGLTLETETLIAEPIHPLSIVGIEVRGLAPPPPLRTVRFDLIGVQVTEAAGPWTDVAIDTSLAAWGEEISFGPGIGAAPSIEEEPIQPEGRLRLAIDPGAAFQPVLVSFGLRPSGSVIPDEIPIVVTNSWLASSRNEIGDDVPLELLHQRGVGRIVGAVETVPTIDPTLAEGIIADLASVSMAAYGLGATFNPVSEYWLEESGTARALRDTLIAAPFETFSLVDLEERTSALTSDPVALGTIGALSVGFIAASMFGAMGFAVSATVSARERLTEFALLRALGLSSRQLAMWMAAEQGVLVGLSLVFGTLVGAVLTSTVLPLITLTQAGTAAVPGIQVVHPVATALQLDLGLLAVLAAVVAVMSVLMRRLGLGSLLRMGDQ